MTKEDIEESGAVEKRRINRPALIWGSALLAVGVWLVFFEVDVKVRLNSEIFPNATRGTQSAKEGAKEVVISPDGPSEDALRIQAEVLPAEGYTVPLKWGDAGKKLVASGAIDMEKYRKNYGDKSYADLLSYLTEEKSEGITITAENAYFWVNTLWALGLTQNSDVLEKGIMMTQYKDKLGSFASTGGWTLGTKGALDLYSSQDIVKLTPQQQALVTKVSEGVYRPCCGNSTAFPDCNHGMAILGLLELMASQGFSEKEMYEASLAFNSYWFPQTYVDLAAYFETKESTPWKKVDPKKALSAEFSSAQGYRQIKAQVGTAASASASGGGCGA